MCVGIGSIIVLTIRSEFNTLITPYEMQVITFTLYQAFLSAAISLLLAIPISRAIHRNHFNYKDLIISVIGILFVLPILVVILAVINIFGTNGIINQIFSYLGFERFSIYGLIGILIGHILINLPFAVRLLISGWSMIPTEHFRLAKQLGFDTRAFFKYIELPMLVKIAPSIFTIIFIVVYNDEGRFLWELSILPERIGVKHDLYGGLAINKDRLAVTTSLGELLLISVSKKRVIWRYDFKRPFRSAPIFHKGYIFGVTGDDIAVSIDLKGKLRWTKKGPQKSTKVFATVSPAASGNKVLFPFSGGSLVALNAVNGIQLWEVNLENSDVGSASASLGDFASDPAVFGSTIFAVGAFGETFAANTNGRVLWRNNIQSSGQLIVSGNAAYYSSNNSSIGRINSRNGKIIFLKNLPGKNWVKYGSPILLQNKLLEVYWGVNPQAFFEVKLGWLQMHRKLMDNK